MNDTYVYVSRNNVALASGEGFELALDSIKQSLDGVLASRDIASRSDGDVSLNLEQSKADDILRAGGFQISPWGVNNTFPNDVLKLINNNNLAPGLVEFKEDMIFGAGIEFVNLVGEPVDHPALKVWLNNWDYEQYILDQISDYQSLYNCFGKIIKTKSGNRIHSLEHVPAKDCRKTYGDKKQQIIVSDWELSGKVYHNYPLFDRYNFDKNRAITMYHFFRPSSGFKFYGMPKYVGVLPFWLPLASKIPQYHLSMIQNSLSAMFHIQIPMEAMFDLKNKRNWTDQQLDQEIARIVDSISEMLTGSENAGKTVYTYKYIDQQSRMVSEWTITPIDSKVKQMSEGYLKLYNDCNQALTSSFQVQPSLACIQLGDKMSSGSEILNAYNLHMQTRTPIPRKLILKPLQMAIDINFKADITVRFKNIVLVKQEENKTGIKDDTTNK